MCVVWLLNRFVAFTIAVIFFIYFLFCFISSVGWDVHFSWCYQSEEIFSTRSRAGCKLIDALLRFFAHQCLTSASDVFIIWLRVRVTIFCRFISTQMKLNNYKNKKRKFQLSNLHTHCWITYLLYILKNEKL